MKRSSLTLVTLIALFLGTMLFSRCGGSESSAASTVDTTVQATQPGAPDNNSANNPSLADTNYRKDSTRK